MSYTLNQTVKIVYCIHNGRNKILRTKTICCFSDKHVSLLLILYLSFSATYIIISLPVPFTIFCIDQKRTLFSSSQFLYENYARKTYYKQWIANQTQWALEKYKCNAEEKFSEHCNLIFYQSEIGRSIGHIPKTLLSLIHWWQNNCMHKTSSGSE